jgi:hypothetical protein
MSRGKKVVLASAGLALAVAFIWANPASAELTKSGVVASADDQAPAAVTELTAAADITGPSVELSWVQSETDLKRHSPTSLDLTSQGTFGHVNDVSAYNIRRDDGTGLQLIDSVGAGESSYTDLSVLSGVIYTYSVTAADAAGNESEAVVSGQISLKPADPGTGVPDAPEQVEIATQVTLVFDVVIETPEDLDRECANAIAVLEGIFPQFAGQLTCAEGSIVITFPETVEDPEEPSLIEQIEDELADPDSPIATLAPVLDLGSLKEGDLDFGDVARDESIAENFAFSNSSDDPEAVLVVSVSVDGDGYSLSTGTLSVAPGESGSFDVNFSAADVANANGSYPGSMTIRTNDPENQETIIALAAEITTGLDPAAFDLSAAAIEFGVQALNVGATESFTITNTGGLDLDVTLELAGDDVFAISSTAETLGEGESADIEVVFTPGESIDYSATITIATNDADNPSATVAISGTGAAPGRPRIELSADAIDFGDTEVDKSSDETLTISNTGGADLEVTLVIAGDDVFAISSTAETLGEGESADIEVVFTPGESIDYSATITIATNDADNPSTAVTLSGTGVPEPEGPECRTALDADGKTLVGFLDDNDVINLFDFFKFADAFGKDPGEVGYDECADFDGNGDINLFDFFKFADAFGKEPVEFL